MMSKMNFITSGASFVIVAAGMALAASARADSGMGIAPRPQWQRPPMPSNGGGYPVGGMESPTSTFSPFCTQSTEALPQLYTGVAQDTFTPNTGPGIMPKPPATPPSAPVQQKMFTMSGDSAPATVPNFREVAARDDLAPADRAQLYGSALMQALALHDPEARKTATDNLEPKYDNGHPATKPSGGDFDPVYAGGFLNRPRKVQIANSGKFHTAQDRFYVAAQNLWEVLTKAETPQERTNAFNQFFNTQPINSYPGANWNSGGGQAGGR
jgi:hypothetical protein